MLNYSSTEPLPEFSNVPVNHGCPFREQPLKYIQHSVSGSKHYFASLAQLFPFFPKGFKSSQTKLMSKSESWDSKLEENHCSPLFPTERTQVVKWLPQDQTTVDHDSGPSSSPKALLYLHQLVSIPNTPFSCKYFLIPPFPSWKVMYRWYNSLTYIYFLNELKKI